MRKFARSRSELGGPSPGVQVAWMRVEGKHGGQLGGGDNTDEVSITDDLDVGQGRGVRGVKRLEVRRT